MLANVIPSLKSQFIQLVPHKTVKSQDHMNEELHKIESEGGEGLVLRNPRSFYEARRSWGSLKLKSYKEIDCPIVAVDGNHGISVQTGGGIVKVNRGVERIDKVCPGQIAVIKYRGEIGQLQGEAVVIRVINAK
jgi:ATP-dependent DNA ligase